MQKRHLSRVGKVCNLLKCCHSAWCRSMPAFTLSQRLFIHISIRAFILATTTYTLVENQVCITEEWLFKSVILTNLFLLWKVSLNSNICVTESDGNVIVLAEKKSSSRVLPSGHISWNLRQESETQMSILSIKTVYFGHDLKDDLRHSESSIDVFCKRVQKSSIDTNFTTSVWVWKPTRVVVAQCVI